MLVMSIKDLEKVDREANLIRRSQRGDVSAFDALVGTEWTPMVVFAQGKLGAREDAEDAVLRAFLKAYAAIGGFDPERPLRPWLRTIVANCCTDVVRRRRDEVALSDLFAESHAGNEDVAADVEVASTAETVRVAISRLPQRYAEVMELRVVEDLPIEEIALRLRRPVGTIKSWLFRARTMLSRSLSPTLTPNGFVS